MGFLWLQMKSLSHKMASALHSVLRSELTSICAVLSLSLSASVPDAQRLQQVMRGPYGLPMDPSLHRATDTTAVRLSEMVSLPVLMKHSVTTPLITQ